MLTTTLGVLAVAALAQAAVTLDTLMETPILRLEAIASAEGEAIADLGSGLVADELDGKPAVRWETKDASVTVRREMKAGNWKVRVFCVAPNGGTDSFWLVLDGEQQTTPFRTSTTTARWAEFGFRVDEQGEHEVKLILREGPGMLTSVFELGRTTIVSEQPPIREDVVEQRPRLYLTPEMIKRLPELAEARKDYYTPAGPPSATLRESR